MIRSSLASERNKTFSDFSTTPIKKSNSVIQPLSQHENEIRQTPRYLFNIYLLIAVSFFAGIFTSVYMLSSKYKYILNKHLTKTQLPFWGDIRVDDSDGQFKAFRLYLNYLVGLALVLRLSPYSRVSTTCVLLTLLYARDVFLVAALLGAPFVLIEYVSIPLCLKMKAGSWAQFLMSPVTFSWVYVIGFLVIKESLSEINYSGVFSWLVRMSIFYVIFFNI
jgi:hypothetical protein